MPEFPTRQADIKALAYTIAIGVWNHRDDFPNIDVFEIAGAVSQYISARNVQNQAAAAAKLATEAKNASLKNLKNIMRNCLKKSEVDVANSPEKLKLIGWAPRENRQPAQLPAQPTNLQITSKENQIVTLKWDRPDDDQPVRNYVIESRRQNGEGFCDWTIVHISYSTQTTLRNQPLGIQLEYRIKAANNAGTGPASNTVAVVL